MSKITEPFPLFLDTNGQPLENGQIFVGLPNQDPRANPIQLYTDEARTIPIAQPVRTLAGRPAFQGAPTNIYAVEPTYSITVLNRRGALVVNTPVADTLNADDALFQQSGTGAIPSNVGDELRALFIRPEQFSSLALADAAAVAIKRPLLLTGTYSITASQTLNADLYFNGGTFDIAAAQTLTLRGQVVNKDILDRLFTGAGSAVGLRYARPEWFGAVRDGVANDSPALNAAMACVFASNPANSRGDRPTIELARGGYGIGNTWTVTPTLGCPLKIIGAGWAVGGTRLQVLPSFDNVNGPMALHIDGNINPIPAIASYEIGGFGIFPGDTDCTTAYQIGGVGKQLLGVQKNLIHDIYVEDGFLIGTFLINCRLINFDRCSWWNRITTASRGIEFGSDATGPMFCGDIDFNECQWVGGRDGGINNTNLQCNPNVAGYEVKGIRFNHSIFYKADKSIEISPSNGAIVGDWWINNGCQFDGFQNYCIYARPVGVGTVFDSFNVNSVYFRGINIGFNAIDIEGDGNARIDAINIARNWFANILNGSKAVVINRASNVHIDFNSLTECSDNTAAMIVGTNLRSFTIIGNTLFQVTPGLQVGYVVSLGTGSDYGAIVHNSSNGSAALGVVQNLSAGTNLTLTPNW